MPGQVRMGHDRNVHRIPPRRRDIIDYHHPMRFSCHGHHYYGYRVNVIPHTHVINYYWGRPYYFCDGIWYRHYVDHYYVCRPPFGYVFDVIDDLAFTACNFAYYNSVYNTYRTINENAALIAEQNEQIAANNALIAQQNESIALNSNRAAASYELAENIGAVQKYADASNEYYYQDGVFYSKTADGKYVVVVPPAGALVQELPDDYDVIEINGKEYYKVDDTIFKTSIVEGAVYFEVVGQLTGELAEKYDLNK